MLRPGNHFHSVPSNKSMSPIQARRSHKLGFRPHFGDKSSEKRGARTFGGLAEALRSQPRAS